MTFIPFILGMLTAFVLVLIVSHVRPKHKCKTSIDELVARIEAEKARRDTLVYSPWHWGTDPPDPGKQVLCFGPRYGRFVARYIPAHVHGLTLDPGYILEDEVLIWCEMPELNTPSEAK